MKSLFFRAVTLMLCCLIPFSALADVVVLPEQLLVVADEAFFGDQSMTAAVVPEGAEVIGERAFAYSGLTSIVLPDSLTEIADNAFEGCEGLVATVHAGSYALSYCIENDIDFVLCEDDLTEMYSVSNLTFNGAEVAVCVSTYAACEILIEVLSETDERVLFFFSGQAGEGLESQDVPVAVPETAAMPEYFLLRAVLLDAEGSPLCTPYVTRHYTAAFAEFESKTPEDYTEGEVLDYGEHGFAVATSDAVKISSVATTADGNAYTFGAPKKPAAGDVLLLTTDGSFYEPVKVLSVTERGDGTYTIRRDANATLSDLYDVVKIDTVMAVGAAQPSVSSGDDASGAGDWEGGIGLSTTFEAKNLTVDVTGKASVGVKTLYDKTNLGEDYAESEYYVDLTLTATGQIDLLNEGMVKPEMGYKKPEFVVYDGPVSLYGAASPIAANLAITIPLDYEFQAGGKFVLEYKQRCGFKQVADNDPVPFKTTDPDCRIELGGGFMVQWGPKIKLSVAVLRGLLEGGISGQAGIRLNGEAVKIAEDMNIGEKTHACDLCCHGEASFFIDIKAEVTSGIDDDVCFTLADFDIASTKWPIGKLYISIQNDVDSPFGGKMHFGWGECPNYKYRTMVYTKNVNGTEIAGLPVSVLSGGTEKGSGTTPYKIYLYNGEYSAEAEFETGEYAREFTVFRSAQEVIITEKDIELSGTVMDAASMDPISGAHVSVTLSEGHTLSTTTNDEGYYWLTFDPVDSFGLMFSADGYLDWSTDVDRSKRSVINVDAQMIPNTYTVSFHPVMGSGTMESLTVKGGTAFSLPMCTFTPPENMKFSAWSIDGKSYSPGSTYTSSGGDVEVYASWEKKLIPDDVAIYNGHAYKVYQAKATWSNAQTLCAASGGHLVTITSSGEQDFVASYGSSFGFSGYMWIGCSHPWNTWVNGEPMSYSNWGDGEPDGWSGQYFGCMLLNDEYRGGSYHIRPGQWDDWQGPRTYYMCEWDTVDCHEVSFNLNGFAGSLDSINALSGCAANLPVPTRDGYTFSGWNTSPDGSGATITSTTAISSNLTLYAQWTKMNAAIPESAVRYNGN